MIRVLHVLGQLNIGGAESRIMDLYRHIDRENVQFDFAVHGDTIGFFEPEIEKLGGKIYHLPRFKAFNYFAYKKAWTHFFAEHKGEFEVVQGHMTSTASIYLPIAKKIGCVNKTIAHVRSAGTDPGLKGALTRFLRRNLFQKADYLFMCSKIAGISAFGAKAVDEGKCTFVPNAIDVPQFLYNEEERANVRKELGIENKVVLGHVGRFHYAKNHEFLLNVFAKMIQISGKDESNLVLLLVGEGPRMDEMKKMSEELGITNQVLFIGNKSDVYRYYQAMDLFLYPSRYEGMPGTIVEAQSAALPILMSDTICDEVIATGLIKTLSISEDDATDIWAQEAMNLISQGFAGRNNIAEKYNQELINRGFDVSGQTSKLTEFYLGKTDKF